MWCRTSRQTPSNLQRLQCCSHILAQYSFSVVATWPVVFAQQDLSCHLCGKDYFGNSKMLHTAFRIGQRDLWIAGCSPVFIWDKWHSLVVHFEMQLSEWPSSPYSVVDTAAWELTDKMCDSGAILSAGSCGLHLQHYLGCLEDLIPCQPQGGTGSATIVCDLYLIPIRRIVPRASQKLPPDFTAVGSRELKLCALLLGVPGCSSKDIESCIQLQSFWCISSQTLWQFMHPSRLLCSCLEKN